MNMIKENTTFQVLVVDDSAAMRMAIREELETGGYDVVESANGLEALVSVCRDRAPDLITLDVERLPCTVCVDGVSHDPAAGRERTLALRRVGGARGI